jgi:hypothetical protein
VDVRWQAFSAVVVLVVLYALARRREARIIAGWRFLLSTRSQQVLSSVRGQLESELTLAELTFEHASTARRRGAGDDATRILEVVRDVVEKFAPGILKLLSAMAAFSRMVSAMAPVRPLRPRAFRIGQIAGLAYLDPLLRHLLVTSAERFRLHVYVIGRSIGVATRFLLEATRRIAGREPEGDRSWKQGEDALADLRTLTDETLESLRALLQSLDRQSAEETLARLEETDDGPKAPLDVYAVGIIVGWLALLALVAWASTFVR